MLVFVAVASCATFAQNTAMIDCGEQTTLLLYTEAAQELFVAQGYIPIVEGLPLPEGTPDIADLKIITVDVDYIGENHELIRETFAEKFNTARSQN